MIPLVFVYGFIIHFTQTQGFLFEMGKKDRRKNKRCNEDTAGICAFLQSVLIFCLLAALFSGCAMLPVPARSERIGEAGPLGSCADFFAALDKRAEEAAVLDPGVFRVKNYPYLRVNRFFASFHGEVNDPAAFAAWTDRMQALDQDARQYEIANLPDSAVAMLDAVNGRAGLYHKVAACGDLLKEADFQDIEQQQKLRERVAAPDEYIMLRRVLGIYPLTRLFVSHGVSKWHAAAHKSFSNEPPVNWQTIRYVSDPKIDWESLHQILAPTKRDALGIPVYSPEQREALFRMYAPVWEIQIQGDDDRIGTPIWTSKGVLDVDIRKPLTYTLLSFTRFGKQILAQLNYIIWFPSRPKQSDWDLYGGLLDGLNYRVTLDSDGAPLLYETVHNCGCYYKAYPTKRLQVRAKIEYAEPPLVLTASDLDPSKNFVTVAMESRTHYVQHFYPRSREWQPEALAYSLADYGQLRSLSYSSGDRRSMFDQYSLAPGSERLERFILWPTGVLSPGGMRQWGRHAVAFVGRRHFDDPFYMDRMFEETGSK
jgi:hypothetical protein